MAVTYTLNGLFGCGATAEGLGFLLNNEMDDFSSKPGTPNMFGLIQGPANAIAPGHRPLSSMTPTIVTTHATPGHPGKPVLILGSPGGSTIITTVANDLISTLVNGLTIQQAADAPRFHHQYLPDTARRGKGFPGGDGGGAAQDGLHRWRARTRRTIRIPGVWGDSELIEIDPITGALSGGHDHRHTFGSVASLLGMAVRIGTAGWSIPRAVAESFAGGGSASGALRTNPGNCAEINSTFYRGAASIRRGRAGRSRCLRWVQVLGEGTKEQLRNRDWRPSAPEALERICCRMPRHWATKLGRAALSASTETGLRALEPAEALLLQHRAQRSTAGRAVLWSPGMRRWFAGEGATAPAAGALQDRPGGCRSSPGAGGGGAAYRRQD